MRNVNILAPSESSPLLPPPTIVAACLSEAIIAHQGLKPDQEWSWAAILDHKSYLNSQLIDSMKDPQYQECLTYQIYSQYPEYVIDLVDNINVNDPRNKDSQVSLPQHAILLLLCRSINLYSSDPQKDPNFHLADLVRVNLLYQQLSHYLDDVGIYLHT